MATIINYEELKRVAPLYAPFFLRIALACVFLYFGISQLRHPEAFIGWLPAEVAQLPLSPRTFVILNGGFETFFATLLLLGLFTRTSALLLGMHLLGITLTIGFTEIGVRDFGLSIATLVLVLSGPGQHSLQNYFASSRAAKRADSNQVEKD